MNSLARNFFLTALFYGVLGIVLGLLMAINKDHGQMPTHAHIMVIGWVSFAIFAFFYNVMDRLAGTVLAKVHFWLAQVSFAGITVGLWLIYGDIAEADPVAAVSSLTYGVSFLLFTFIAASALLKR